MPRRHSAGSLRAITVDYVSRHFEVFCCSRGSPPSPPSPPSLPDLASLPSLPSLAITCLPSNLLSELLTHLALTHLGQLPSNQLHLPGLALHLLLQPQTSELRLLPSLPALPAASLLAQRCSRLVTLDLSFCTALAPASLSSLFSHLPLLAQLDLSATRADDLTLASLGQHCPRLASVNLEHTAVTGHGLACLSRHTSPGLPACPALVHLNLLDTAVIPYSVYEVIVNHPRLREVRYESFEEVLRCFTVMNDALGECEKCHLRTLNFINCHGSLLSSLQHCPPVFPHLSGVSILQSDLTRSCLDSLRLLPSLTSLELGNSSFTQYTVYFHEHVMPVLDHLTKLTHLSLERFKFVDIEAIGESCPKLQSLKLSKILSFCNTKLPRFPLLNLESLTLLNTRLCRVTDTTLRSLLSSPPLSSLHLHSLPCLSDQLLLSLLQSGRLSCLSSATLQYCPSLSAVGLSLLLASPSPLSSLYCWQCGLREEEREAVSEAVREARLDLSLDWSRRGATGEEEAVDPHRDLPDLEEMDLHMDPHV